MNRITRRLGLFLLCLTSAALPARGVIIYNSPVRNTSAPTGTLANSGWQHQGHWNGFIGTPIAPNYFITAGHVGGSVGGTYYLGTKTWKTVAMYDDPNSDLRIWKVSGSFSSWAPLYTTSTESGKNVVLFGRGTQRGAEVRVNNQLKGWKWGADDRVKSWGLNKISAIGSGGAGVGNLLKFNFDPFTNEGHLSIGDSGGGLFIQDNGVWKLAGINYATDGPYSLTGTTGSGFSASIFDKGGLYTGRDGAWRYNLDSTINLPAASYSTRISSNMNWINSIILPRTTAMSQTATSLVPEPGVVTLLLVAGGYALTMRRPRRDRR